MTVKELVYETQICKTGNYYIPDLFLTEGNYTIGKYGRLRRDYLKKHRPIIFSNLLLSGELYRHLSEIDRACIERIDLLTRQMANREGSTEALKAVDQFEWVRRMNSIQNRAEEIVLNELVYC